MPASASLEQQQQHHNDAKQQQPHQPTYEELLEAVGSRRLYQGLFLCLTAVAVAFPSMQMMSFNFTLLSRSFKCASANDSAAAANASADCGCANKEFDNRFMTETAMQTFGIACDWSSATAIVKAMFMVGFLFGSTGYGILSDRWGRRKSFMLACVTLSISGVVAAFATEIVGYCLLRALVGFSAAGVLTVSYTWHTEMLSTRDRFTLSLVMKNGWSLGILSMTGLAYVTRDWRFLELGMAAPALLLLLYYFVLAESPRWLLSQGKTEEAAKALQQMASINGTQQQLEQLMQQRPAHSQLHCSRRQDATTFAPLHSLLRLPNLRVATAIVWANFCITSIGYYGISLDWSRLGGNPFLTMALGAGVEVAARMLGLFCGCCGVGRTHLLLVSLAIGAASLTSLTAKHSAWVALALGGRFGLLLAFEIIWLYGNELFPTVVRNSAVGFGSTAARVGGVIAPQLALLAAFWPPAPLLIFGLLALIGSCLTVLLPETRGRACADSLEEAEELCSSNRIVDACRGSSCWRRHRRAAAKAGADTEANAVPMRRAASEESLQPESDTDRPDASDLSDTSLDVKETPRC